jgi:hypothetical protein
MSDSNDKNIPKEKDLPPGGLRLIVGDLARSQGRMIGLFALLIIISGNFLAELFPPGVEKILHTNRYVKHAFAFLTLFFFVFLTMPDLKTEGASLVFGIYFIFLVSSKLSPKMWFIIVGLITLLYLIEIREERLLTEDTDDGKVVSTDTRLMIIDDWVRPGAVVTIMLTTLYGVIDVGKKYMAKSSQKQGNIFQFLFERTSV